MYIQGVVQRYKTASVGAFARPAPLLHFVATALVGPFVLFTIGGTLSNNLPWSFWATTLMLLLAVICAGYLRFAHESHEAEDISISPDRS